MPAGMMDALGWALIHSLWQCAAIALLYAVFSLASRGVNANVRYLGAAFALLAMPLSAAATFLALWNHHDPAAVAALAPVRPVLVLPAVHLLLPANAPARPLPYLPAIVWSWLAGVVLMSTWSAAGWLAAQRWKRRANRALPEVWQSRMAALASQLEVRRAVRVCESALAQVPAVIGWIRPVILIPAAALINLSVPELEAVLAHELAHIRRLDYVANLVQSAIESLMFYHPAVWWISKRIRAERENCCDDLAVSACGNKLVYARALAALEELRAVPQFAMAATGGSLLHRVRRLLGQDTPRRRSLPVWIALAAVLITVLAVSGGIRLRAQNQPAASTPAPAAPPAPPARPAAKARAPRTPKPAASTPALPATAPAARTPEPTTPPAPAAHREGFLAGLVDAGYTDISVDDIIALRDNGLDPRYIAGMLQAGLGRLSPKDLITLHGQGVSPEYARQAVASGIPQLSVARIIDLQNNGVNPQMVQRIHALGFGPFNAEQAIDLQRNGVSADLFEALKEAGYTRIDAHQAVEAQQNGLSARSLRNLREQGFKGLTFEQVIKLCRAGVI